MTYEEMNSYILDYLKFDITGRAIMLTGDWGSGKSFYVKNKLKDFLERNNKKSVIVSLFGLSDVSEISKALFFELHPIIKKITPAGGAVKALGKTALNALSNKIGFDLEDPSEEVMQNLYELVDFTDTLVILEDIERTQIEPIKLLGYVNNLCENDRVKVLLVTNEKEILTTYEKPDGKGEIIKFYTESAVSYKRTKEKTVGDTIHFTCDIKSAIQNIISAFSPSLQEFNSKEHAESIHFLFFSLESYNLRAFIYGCQKCRGILDFINQNHITISTKIKEMIFFGVIAFTQRQSTGVDLHFEADTYLSGSLGFNDQLPLFRFCYDYILFQRISADEIRKAVIAYDEYEKKGLWNSEKDKDLKIIKYFNKGTEEDVRSALLNIPAKIKNGMIPYQDYGVLVNYIVAIRYEADIDFNIEDIINPLIEALKKIQDNIIFEVLFSSSYALYNPEGINCFEAIKQRMKTAFNSIVERINFSYNPSDIKDFYEEYIRPSADVIRRNGFAYKIEIERFAEMIKKCSSGEISTLRSLFMDLYRDRPSSLIVDEDYTALKNIHASICPLIEYEGYDKIQKMQLKWFVKNLSDIISCLENQIAQVH